jgi:tetratricopeptide (TPR) repeat protein
METLRFQDFEIEIGAGVDGRHPVVVLRSPSGQARATLRLPFAPAQLAERLAAVEDAILKPGSGQEQVIRGFGDQLFEALITGDVRAVYDRSRQAADSAGEGLRLKLRLNAPDLATIPWELLYDARRGEFLALSRYTPVVRYLELPLGEARLAVRPPLRILGMVAGPSDLPVLDLAKEKARLEQAIAPLRSAGKLDLVWLEGQTWRDLQEAMQRGPWHVFHFIGHASFDQTLGEGSLLLADDAGRATPLGATELGLLLADQRTLRLAVLNACEGARGSEQNVFSSTAAALVQRGLPAVLAMQYAISDQAAIEFTTSFYEALAANLPIDAAVSEARKAIHLAAADSMEWATPVLFMRAPDGFLWEVQLQRKAPRLVIAGAAVAIVIVLSVLIWIAASTRQIATVVTQPTPTASPSPTPAAMRGGFNIAVANFGEIDAATGQVRESQAGQTLSQWLFEGLAAELERNRSIPLAGEILVWHDSQNDPAKNRAIGVIAGDSPQARQAAAAELAATLNAHMVIFGHYVTQENAEPGLDLEFYLSPLASKDEFATITGSHSLGKTILLPASFNMEDPQVRIGVKETRLGPRGRAVFWLTVGLTQQLFGRSEQALETFEQAEQALADWPESDGKEILYFFLGREHLILGNVDAAQGFFEQAVAVNPGYARAQVGLGSVFARRARETVDPAARLQAPGYLSEALDRQEQGVALAVAAEEPVLEAVGRTALAKSYRLLGQTHYELDQLDAAAAALEQAIAEAGRASQLLSESQEHRLLAQAQETLGAANLQQANLWQRAGQLDEAKARAELARQAYQACIDQGRQAPFDEFLQQIVIAGQSASGDVDGVRGCRPILTAVVEPLLAELSGDAP